MRRINKLEMFRLKSDETFYTILARFARYDLHALPETLHVLLETQSSLRETFYDSHETVKGLHKTFFKMFHVLFFFSFFWCSGTLLMYVLRM